MKTVVMVLALLSAPALAQDTGQPKKPIERIMAAANLKNSVMSECERAQARVHRLKQLAAVSSVRLMQATSRGDVALQGVIRTNLTMIAGAHYLALDEQQYRCKEQDK